MEAATTRQPPLPPGRMVVLSKLTPAKKREVWEWIKAECPDMADWIQGPAQDLIEAFDGRLLFGIDPNYVEEGDR